MNTETYFLIKNTSGMTYWSYRVDKSTATGYYAKMVEKYGPIYINDCGGFMTENCIEKVLEVRKSKKFPI